MHIRIFSFITLLFSASSCLSGEILAQWTFADDLEASKTADGVTASALATSPGLSQPAKTSIKEGITPDGSSYGGAGNNRALHNQDWSGHQGRVFARVFKNLDQDYYSFEITLEPDTRLQMVSLQFDAGFRAGGPNRIRVQYSLNQDFSDPVTLGEGAGWLRTSVTGLNYGPEAEREGVPGLPSLGVPKPTDTHFSWNRYTHTPTKAILEGTVYFRIQASGSTLENSDANLYLDNITIEAVPRLDQLP